MLIVIMLIVDMSWDIKSDCHNYFHYAECRYA
jgi:hypothetical protein